jgi:hypothetical protein
MDATFPHTTPAQARRARLPDQITIEYGPIERLGRYFLLLDKEASARGLSLSLHSDFAELERVNAANQQSWSAITPLFDHRCGGIGPENGFWIAGRNAAGEIVATQAARLYAWLDRTLESELTSLRLFYAAPMRQKQPTERCLVTAPCAREISGRVVFSGSTWVRPDYRGQGLASILPRLSRAYAFTRWYSDITMSMVRRKLVEGGVVRAYGYKRVEYSVHWLGSAKGDLELAVVWMDRAELLADMEHFMATRAAMPLEPAAKRA